MAANALILLAKSRGIEGKIDGLKIEFEKYELFRQIVQDNLKEDNNLVYYITFEQSEADGDYLDYNQFLRFEKDENDHMFIQTQPGVTVEDLKKHYSIMTFDLYLAIEDAFKKVLA